MYVISLEIRREIERASLSVFGTSYRHSFCFSGQYDQFLRDRQKLVERVDGIVRFQDLLLAVELEVRTEAQNLFVKSLNLGT